MENQNVIYGINGCIVTVKDARSFSMMEMVYVGHERLVGEVIGITDKFTTIQVYEETVGLTLGEPIVGTGSPMNVTLGPGIMNNIFDGIARPLKDIAAESGTFIARGSKAKTLDEEKLWDVTVKVAVGDKLVPGDVYAEVPETFSVMHKCMLTPKIKSAVVTKVMPNGQYRVNDTVVEVEDELGRKHELTLCQRWPIRVDRPVSKRVPSSIPLITGQRIQDSLFPLAKGGTACIPGAFGSGKTMTQHQLAKWCDADIIVYVGCGERGNEMTQALEEFAELVDPRTGRLLLERTVLIANTSNMPVAAREASIYTGITLAEYYRDMGYHVAMMADSTSRWAEALREISGRLEEMPAEEGFPAYLPSRLAEFYERAGYVHNLNGTEGSISIVGAISPAGGDFSEPVTQNTMRFTRCFWALDKNLAYARHFPAIDWLASYTEYDLALEDWYNEHLGEEFIVYRNIINDILQEENKLMEIVKLVGADVLPDDQKLVIEIARVVRVGFLQQNAFHPDDTYVPIEKQRDMMKVIVHLYNKSKQLVAANVPLDGLLETGIYERVIKMKYEVPNNDLSKINDIIDDIDNTIAAVLSA
ncbi:MAG: V-type ATP synthase subunit A [Oscillospiraceae bacterium]|nr:V-type ATP synthase subunit A [Oscillospiraceae bacterium]